MKIKGIIYIIFIIVSASLSMQCLANPYKYPPQLPGEEPTNNPGHSSYYPNYQFAPLMQEYGSNPYHDNAREKRYPSNPDDNRKHRRRPIFPYPTNQ